MKWLPESPYCIIKMVKAELESMKKCVWRASSPDLYTDPNRSCNTLRILLISTSSTVPRMRVGTFIGYLGPVLSLDSEAFVVGVSGGVM